MRIIVDTNIVFSTILNSSSRIGQILLCSKDVRFYSSKYLQKEIQKHINKIKKLIRIPESELLEIIESIYSHIHFISEELISKEALKIADELTRTVDFNDVLFVALALQLECKIWTGDIHLINGLKLKGFQEFITTQELLETLHK